jgi:hypothetical protein
MTTQRQAPQTTYRTALEDIEISADVESAIAQMQASGKDTGSLTAQQRAGYVTALCRALRLNPLTSPVQFIKLNGKEVLYVTRTATDQLAAIHGLNRKTVRGPEIVDIAGTKIAICAVEVTLPNGRSETATATLPVSDPAMLYMKLETKAKRRGTLAILGLGLLAEEEAESIPGAERVDLAPALPAPAPKPSALDDYRACLSAAGCLFDAAQDYRLLSQRLHAEDATTAASEALAEWLDAGGYVMTATEQRAAERGDYPREMLDVIDAVAECASGADVVRWWGQTAHVVEALGAHAKAAKLIVAKTYCARVGDTSKSPAKVFAAALAPKPPPTGTDSPSSARGDTGAADAPAADAAPSAEALASIARVGDPHAYLATKSTYTEIERAVVAHGAHVPALAAAAVARLEALGEGGDDGNRARLVAAWVSESASRAQRAERTASQVRRAA